jgi:ABC-type iron transport system FetAB ATPase subunit
MTFEVRDLAVGHVGPEGRGHARALLRGLSFTVGSGERVALVGPSGAGKTTVLRALALLDDPLEGTLALDGRSPEAHGVVRWRRRVVLVAQRAVFFGGTVADELARPFTYASAERPFDAAWARAHLAEVGLERAWERPVERLSEGERQRVAFVRALALRPSVLLLDEPTSALDPVSTEKVEALLAGADVAIVLVTHHEAQRERLHAKTVDLAPLRVDHA